MLASRRTLSCLAASLAIACDADPRALDWQIGFSSPGLDERAAVVEARILAGGCASSDVVYESRFQVGERPTLPPSLPPGVYGFSARVVDGDCLWYAAGCAEKRLPLDDDGQVRVELDPLSGTLLSCDGCNMSTCDPGGQPDAASDAAPIAPDAPLQDSSSEAVTIVLEAESANPLLSPFAVLEDENASGGAYISYLSDPMSTEPVTAFRRAEAPTVDSDGLATYVFTVPQSGDYRMWARVITPTLDEDSFWFQMDGGPWILWNDMAHPSSWDWVDIREFERRTQILVLSLAEGTHTLVVGYRELNAKLDKLLFASDLSYVPTGL